MLKDATEQKSATRRETLSLLSGTLASLILPIWSYAKHFWPVRTVEKSTPKVDLEKWRLVVDGLVHKPLCIRYDELKNLPSTTQVSDLNCVEIWTVKRLKWQGILLRTVIENARPKPEAKFLRFHCTDGVYSESLTIEQALVPNVLLAYAVNGKPLFPEHGFPLRLVAPDFWAYKNAKWIERIEFIKSRHLGYWELRGYGPDSGPKKQR